MSTTLRSQGTNASGNEIAKVTDYLECDPEFEAELVQLHTAGKEGKSAFMESLNARDEMYELEPLPEEAHIMRYFKWEFRASHVSG